MRALSVSILIIFSIVPFAASQDLPETRSKEAYVRAVTRGAGWMPWQNRGVSEAEKEFRAEIERRKDELTAHSDAVVHPAIYTPEDIARAKTNAESDEWAKSWIDNQISAADSVLAQPDGWIESMIPEEAPAHGYGFTCPNCVGDKSQEAVGYSLAGWSGDNPDVIACRACSHEYPSEEYPETAELILPRTGHRITYYVNERERANPEDRSGKLAWHWVGHPIHVSFSGLIRERKIGYMRSRLRTLGFAYAFTEDVRYAEAARDILLRFAHCYRQWPYRDYWDGYADCDPLYAAHHDNSLPIEWKRHLSEGVYADDKPDRASMEQSYWGAGRFHPSTDGISGLHFFTLAYDLTCTAKHDGGSPVYTSDQRRTVERELILEYILGAEPYVGGPGKAENHNNKAPRVYTAMASVAKCLGVPAMADTALRGYEIVRDESFNADGFCTESPSYNNMYLATLLVVPEFLHGFEWPADYEARSGVVDYYKDDPKLRRMYRAVLWTTLGDGTYLPLSDTHVGGRPSTIITHMGLRRYPDLFSGALPRLASANLSEYTIFNLTREQVKEDGGYHVPETYFPDWQTAILRDGSRPDSATVSMALNPPGGHRQSDNLALYYFDGGDGILGDLGYVGDMPTNRWIRSTRSHNLVVVDDSDQKHSGRNPEFEFMATSPFVSVVEATSDAYEQCAEYRRRIAFVRAGEGRTFVVDIFHVKGGSKHAFRVYSEIAASDRPGGAIHFDGVDMPEEPPLPDVGTSLAPEDIFGLRDVRSAVPDEQTWTATWKDDQRAYRLWMLSKVDRVEASNGPGQRDRKENARRVRYVDAVREGGESTFVAIHAPSQAGGSFIVQDAKLLNASDDGALVIEVSTSNGEYLLFNDCVNKTSVGNTSFQGRFAAVHRESGSYLTVGGSLLQIENEILESRVTTLVATGFDSDESTIRFDSEVILPTIDSPAAGYVRAKTANGWTGYPVRRIAPRRIEVRDYPLPKIDVIELASVRYGAGAKLTRNPFFVFDNGAGRGSWTPDQQASTIAELGYDGISYSGLEDLEARIDASGRYGVRIFNLYVPCYVDREPAFSDELRDAIKKLAGTDIAIWLTVQGKASDDVNAIAAVREITELAAASGIDVALYPHAGFHVATIEDALRIAEQIGAENLGVTFNLCHELMAGNGDRADALIRKAARHLRFVSINGADPEGGWDKLIQRLGEGSYDVAAVLRTLNEINYTGPIGLQCYQVPGDTRANLEHNIAQWKEYRPIVTGE